MIDLSPFKFKNYSICFLIFCMCYSSLAQNESFKLEDYEWLHDLEPQENLKWVEERKTESLNYLTALKILPQLEAWKKKFNSQYKLKPLTREIDAYQVGDYAEKLMGGSWARMQFSNLISKSGPPKMTSIQSLNLTNKGDLLFDEVISRPPDYDNCLIFYKKRGNRVLRGLVEYNWKTSQVIENGFQLPPAETQIQWRDKNSVYISTNLDNKYEHGSKLRIWKRGEPIENARILFETQYKKTRVKLINRNNHLFVLEEKQAFDVNYFYLKNDQLIKLNLPNDVKEITFVSGQFVVHLRSSWKPNKTYFPAGSLISIDFESFLNGSNNFNLIAASNKDQVIDEIWNTDDILISRTLENVQSVLIEFTFSNGQWQSNRLDFPIGNNLTITETQKQANRYFIEYKDFFKIQHYLRQANGNIDKIKEYKGIGNEDDYEINQWFATSKDGTQVPYFVVYKKGLEMTSNNPVIMTGYGGWGISILPKTLNQYLKWLDDGGVYVLTNIRGGGEYGPDWHEAARKSNRQNAYDDFKAVAEDLIDRKVTQKGLIGSYGSSNGGLLVANGFIQNPNLFSAVVIRSGSINLYDTGGGNGRSIGAIGERGDPDNPEDWKFMKKFSPLHNLETNKNYPPILLYSSRNDDVSHAGESRKFYQRMKDLGYSNVFLIETAGGTHGGTDLPNDKELELAFFYKNLHPKYKELVEN